MNRILIFVFTFCAFEASLSEETPQDGLLVFETDILPILETRCLACHEGEKAKGGLDLKKSTRTNSRPKIFDNNFLIQTNNVLTDVNMKFTP